MDDEFGSDLATKTRFLGFNVGDFVPVHGLSYKDQAGEADLNSSQSVSGIR